MKLIESLRRTWAEPAGKAVFVAAGMLTVAVVALGSSRLSFTGAVPDPSTSTEPTEQTLKTFDESKGWDSAYNTQALEKSIKENSASSQTGVAKTVASVSCKPTQTKGIFLCNVRELGDPEPTKMRIEVDFDGDTWAGQSV